MKETDHKHVCERTEKDDERVRLRNRKNGATGLTFGCTTEGNTIQVELPDGSFDTWLPEDCEEVTD